MFTTIRLYTVVVLLFVSLLFFLKSTTSEQSVPPLLSMQSKEKAQNIGI